MAATYTSPSNSDSDAVRFLVRDTDTTAALLQDAEIAWLLTEESNVYLAAATAALQIGAKFTALADKQVGDLRISYRNQSSEYQKLAASLKERGGIRAARPFAGGLTDSGKDAVEEDSDRVKPSFKRGMHDNPNPDATLGKLSDP